MLVLFNQLQQLPVADVFNLGKSPLLFLDAILSLYENLLCVEELAGTLAVLNCAHPMSSVCALWLILFKSNVGYKTLYP